MLEAAFWGAYVGIHIGVAAVGIMHSQTNQPPQDVYTFGDPAAIIEAMDTPTEVEIVIVTE